MTKPTHDCLTARHLQLFGAIVQWFARHELLMHEIMAVVSGADTASVMLLTQGLDFRGKRHALLDLLRHRAVPMSRFDAIAGYLLVANSHAGLRDDIVHHAWEPAHTSSTVQPDWVIGRTREVRPVRDDPAKPSAGFIMSAREKMSYSLDDLTEIAATLAANHAAFLTWSREAGLLPGAASA